MNLEYKNELSVEDYNSLREAVGWGMLVPEQAKAGLEHSCRVIGCRHENRIAGGARILWDGGYIAYLADVMVMPGYQGCGIGTEMVKKLLAYMKTRLQEGWKIKVVILAAKGKEPFYEKFGFNSRPNEEEGSGMNLWL